MHLLSHTRQQTASYILITGADGHTLEEYDLAQCCHCALHFRIQPGSGTLRGWCCNCGQITCGRQTCQSCVPFEKQMARALLRQQLFKALGL